MREIEFRGKSVINGKWVNGWLNATTEEDGEHYWINKCLCAEGGIDCAYQVDPETVGQYTGLKDKNGKKIFEGDIVRYIDNDLIEYVEFIDGVFFAGSEELRYAYCEVIGNIYDNKELLEEQNANIYSRSYGVW